MRDPSNLAPLEYHPEYLFVLNLLLYKVDLLTQKQISENALEQKKPKSQSAQISFYFSSNYNISEETIRTI
jgi:hypothetical protein